jgi:hypothetical protein
MSLADPQSITVTGVTTSLPRTGDADGADDGSVYTSGDGLLKLTASHIYAKRTRRVLRIDASKLSPDAFKPDENVKRSMSCYMVFDTPPDGFTAAEALALYKGLVGLMTASSDAVVVKLLGGES